MLYLSRITDATVDAFATCGFNVRMRKYASCGPRLTERLAMGSPQDDLNTIMMVQCIVISQIVSSLFIPNTWSFNNPLYKCVMLKMGGEFYI